MIKYFAICLLVLAIGVDFTSKLLSIVADAVLIGGALLVWQPWKKETKDS